MKSASDWIDGNGTNSSGFNGLPSGFYFKESAMSIGEFGGLGSSVGYWSATENDKYWVHFWADL